MSAHLLSGGDIAYYVGFVVAAIVFAVASRIEGDRPSTAGDRRVLASATAAGDPELHAIRRPGANAGRMGF